eukprot:m.28231 g.28231  ORF g.28231 m.28231 type:complete len:89 (+) comp9452_c0_seq2:1233-1499(+)
MFCYCVLCLLGCSIVIETFFIDDGSFETLARNLHSEGTSSIASSSTTSTTTSPHLSPKTSKRRTSDHLHFSSSTYSSDMQELNDEGEC